MACGALSRNNLQMSVLMLMEENVTQDHSVTAVYLIDFSTTMALYGTANKISGSGYADFNRIRSLVVLVFS